MNNNKLMKKYKAIISSKPKSKKEKVLKIKTVGTLLVMVFTIVVSAVPVMAAAGPVESVNKLSEVIFSLLKAVGTIASAWGIVQIGMSTNSHDPSQRSQGFLSLAGGLIIFFVRELLTFIGG